MGAQVRQGSAGDGEALFTHYRRLYVHTGVRDEERLVREAQDSGTSGWSWRTSARSAILRDELCPARRPAESAARFRGAPPQSPD